MVRSRDGSDRRSVIVQLTPKGIALADEVMPVLFAQEGVLLSEFATPEELETLVPLLRRLLLAMDAAE
ncbi:hypothetical protein [Synechococcus elongatus]|uniref:HTH marR-type domain-containing protein n=1 Tax=Synechococcus elongatus PCC 11802 TaxID=2283154 RepID=A0AAT9JSA5_SYNEL|nr:hypothetical protein [Synechococcus elongatus]